jgi:hypothetical protein
MSDLEVRQRLQTSTYGESRHLIKWINSLEVLERLADPALGHCPCGTTILQSGPWVVYRGVSLNTNAMTAAIFVAERNEVDTILQVAIKHPAYRQSPLPASVSLSAPPIRFTSFH